MIPTRSLFLLLVSLVLPATADAGKLAEGFRGVPFGPADPVLTAAPMEGCARDTEIGVRWDCPTTIGGVAVHVAYIAQEGLFPSLVVYGSGYTDAATLFPVLKASYGEGSKLHDWDDSLLADWHWRDGDVVGMWDYNQFSDRFRFTMFDTAVMERVKQIQAEKAKSSTGDL
jgi:hypothetical protein